MTAHALVPSPTYAFDTAACDVIVAKHYPNFEAALDAWRSAEYETNPDRYIDAGTVMEALAQAEELLHGRFDEYEARLAKADAWGESEPEPNDRPASDAELERALRDIIRTSRTKADIEKAICRDGRFTTDPVVEIDGNSVSIMVSRADYRSVIIVHEFFILASNLEPADGPSEEELKNALREMVRRSHDEKELRSLIAADGRFDDNPWIQVDPDGWRLPGDTLPDTSVLIIAHARDSGVAIRY